MRQLDKVTAGALLLSVLTGLVVNVVTNCPFAYELIIMLGGSAIAIFGNVAYNAWDKRGMPKQEVKVEVKAEERVLEREEKPSPEVKSDPRGYCSFCGIYNSPVYNFCHKCGAPLGREPKVPEVTEQISNAVEPDRQIIVQQDQFSIDMAEKFNDIQGFIDKRLVRMEVVLQVASEQVKNKMMTASEFVQWAKEKQAEVEAVDGETDKWLSGLAELRAKIVQRLDYAKSSQGHMAIKRAEAIPDPEKMREYITVQRQHFELQERIARRLMDWHNGMEKALTDTKVNIDEMFWQAILASIPVEVKAGGERTMVPVQEKA